MKAAMRARRRAHGFTLLELLIAVALLSVLAMLSWRGMDSVLRGRDRIVSASDELRSLSVALSQMEEDLRRSWSIRLLGLSEPSIAFALGDGAMPDMALLRETSGADAMQVQRVIYRLRAGRFERGFGPWAAPSPDGSQPVAETPITWQPLLENVDEVRYRAWVPSRGWQPANTIAQSAPQVSGQTRAASYGGVEFVVMRRGERIVRVFPVGD